MVKRRLSLSVIVLRQPLFLVLQNIFFFLNQGFVCTPIKDTDRMQCHAAQIFKMETLLKGNSTTGLTQFQKE